MITKGKQLAKPFFFQKENSFLLKRIFYNISSIGLFRIQDSFVHYRFGTGYVGFVTGALLLCRSGNMNLVCRHWLQKSSTSSGRSSVFEFISRQWAQRNIANNGFFGNQCQKGWNFFCYFSCVGTPASLSEHLIFRRFRHCKLFERLFMEGLVIKSTVPPGTEVEECRKIIVSWKFRIENLFPWCREQSWVSFQEGCAISNTLCIPIGPGTLSWHFWNTEKFMFHFFVSTPFFRVTPQTAETIKICFH